MLLQESIVLGSPVVVVVALVRGWPGGGPRASDSTDDGATKENLGGQDYRAFRNGQKWGFLRRKRQMLF